MSCNTNVLIVEADNTSASQIEEYIKNEGYKVVSVASNGMAALQALSSFSIDLAIIDYGLPDSWSETVMHALRKKQLTAPIVLLGKPGIGKPNQLRLKNNRAFYLPRPFSRSELLETAAKAVKTNCAHTNS
ncbi:MAG: response regulator [Chitinophagaceae bacterium]|nr:MAG: response regulator [Chitinophagaceae bacterium]